MTIGIELGVRRIRMKLPPVATFDLDTMTNSRDFVVARDDLEKPSAGIRWLNQNANCCDKGIEIRSEM